jgi:hypothetical protein
VLPPLLPYIRKNLAARGFRTHIKFLITTLKIGSSRVTPASLLRLIGTANTGDGEADTAELTSVLEVAHFGLAGKLKAKPLYRVSGMEESLIQKRECTYLSSKWSESV